MLLPLIRRNVLAFILATASILSAPIAYAGKASTIDKDVDAAMTQLVKGSPKAKSLKKSAAAVLVFPKIVKAGFIVGGQYGEGALRVKGKTIGYYSIVAGSYGLQAGGQSFGYALFFMKQSALDYLRKSKGWSVGSGPSVVVLDKGAATSTTSTTITQDVVAIPFNQRGLMAGLGLEGSKISPISPD